MKIFDGAKSKLEHERGYKRAMDILLCGYVNEAKCLCKLHPLFVFAPTPPQLHIHYHDESGATKTRCGDP
jgi:hypothetical protein